MSGVAPLADGWPTLSELKASTFGHLGQAADWFDGIADKAQSAFEELAREVRRPGGVEWEGAAGDQAANQADADLVKVRGWAWDHRQAAGMARRGQEWLESGQREALDAIDDVERAGFAVGGDYSVTDTREVSSREQLAQRQGQAQAHRDFIRHRVAHLVANDRFITDQLKETTANFGNLIFEEPPAAKERGSGAADGIPLGFNDVPEARIVWCVPGPRGGPWAFHCEVLYSNGTTDTYYTDEDESGGHL